jgi:hypothetical protein
MKVGERLVAVAVALAIISTAVTGCSAESNAASSLATTASDAAAAAQTVSFDLRLMLDGKLTAGLNTTALSDGMMDLQKADSTLTGSQEPDAVQGLATQSLDLVRQAEDATQQAQRAVEMPHPASTLRRLSERLKQISESLSKIQKAAKAKS